MRSWLSSWPRLLLWAHILGVLGFYMILWRRTVPGNEKAQPLKKDERLPEEPFVSIIVPARNEERNIRRCVESLLAQDYGRFEVIVVDDGSTDATPRILDEIAATNPHKDRLYVLRLRDALPEGWAGKPHALQMGTQEARGEWFLYTDADTWHAPDALRFAITRASEGNIDLLSLGTQQELPGFWERVMMPMAYLGISMMYPVRLVNDPHSPVAIANGQFILIRRSVYEQIGGYARPDLRSTLLDDRDLAQVVKSQHYRLQLLDGRDYVHVQMYSGLREIWRGWRKNVFLGSRGGLAFTLLQLIGLPMVSILPFLLPLLLLLRKIFRPRSMATGTLVLVSALELLPVLGYRAWLDREVRVPWYYAFTHPLAGALFEGILAQSTWRILTRTGVDWRGRSYYTQKQAVSTEKQAVPGV